MNTETTSMPNGSAAPSILTAPIPASVKNATSLMIPTNIEELRTIASLMVASGYFKGTQDVAQACVKIMAGAELGMSPIASMNHVYIIGGKTAFEAILIGSAIRRRGYNYKPVKWDAEGAEIEFFNREGQSIGISSFLKADAQTASLLGKDNWKSFPKSMYWARALSMGGRAFCADIFGGIAPYTPEELGAEVDGEGRPTKIDAAPASPRAPSQFLRGMLEDTYTEQLDKLDNPDTLIQPLENPWLHVMEKTHKGKRLFELDLRALQNAHRNFSQGRINEADFVNMRAALENQHLKEIAIEEVEYESEKAKVPPAKPAAPPPPPVDWTYQLQGECFSGMTLEEIRDTGELCIEMNLDGATTEDIRRLMGAMAETNSKAEVPAPTKTKTKIPQLF